MHNKIAVEEAMDKIVKLVKELLNDGDFFLSAIELYNISGACWKIEIEEALKELRIARGEEE